MGVIDEEGRLFGLVNIIDLFVVLLLLAVVVAGMALLLEDEEDGVQTRGTTYATLDLGTQPDYLLGAFEEGDSYAPTGASEITITDVYLAPDANGSQVVLRVALQGPQQGETITYDGAPPRLGRTVDIAADLYHVSGRIVAVGDRETLATQETTVVLQETMDANDATAIAAGDSIDVGGRTVARVEDVAVYPTENSVSSQVVVEARVRTLERDGDRLFGDTPIRPGQTLSLRHERYALRGRIERIGSGLTEGSTDVLVRDVVDSETAERLAVGDTSSIAGREVGRVESVQVFGTAEPGSKLVFVGMTLSTLELRGRATYGTTPIQEGRSITFETDAYRLTGPIKRVGHLAQRGTPTTVTVTLGLDSMPAEMAAAIRPGLVEQNSDTQVARVTDVAVEPETIMVRGQNGTLETYDHPTQRTVTVTAELRVRETAAGLRFKGEPIRQGSTIALDLETAIVKGRVIAIR